jgi:hypothetical protein
MHQASGSYCSIHSGCSPFHFSFLADDLLSHMIAQHTLCIATVLVAGNHDISNVQPVPLVVGIFMLTQHDFMLVPIYSTFWACISIMTESRGFGPSTFFFCFLVINMSLSFTSATFSALCIRSFLCVEAICWCSKYFDTNVWGNQYIEELK